LKAPNWFNSFDLTLHFGLQPLAPGKHECSVWKYVQDNPAIVDRELIEKMFKMSPAMQRAEFIMKTFVIVTFLTDILLP
jgi:hypothetical protein